MKIKEEPVPMYAKNHVSDFVDGIQIGMMLKGSRPTRGRIDFDYDDLDLANLFVNILNTYDLEQDRRKAFLLIRGLITAGKLRLHLKFPKKSDPYKYAHFERFIHEI